MPVVVHHVVEPEVEVGEDATDDRSNPVPIKVANVAEPKEECCQSCRMLVHVDLNQI